MYVPLLRASPKPLSVTASPTRKRVPAPSACSTFARPASLVSSLLPSVTVPVQLGSALPNVPISGRYQTLSGQMSTVPPSSANTFGPLTSVQPSTGVPLKYSVWPVHQSSPPSTANSPFALPPPVG